MGIREDFSKYIDGNGLNTPNPGTWNPGQSGSDNNMYTSEYYIILNKNGQLTEQDKTDYENKMNQCIGSDLLNRVPVGQNDGIEGPDDHYALYNACHELGITSIPRTLLWGCIKYFGAMNNVSPGTWTAQSFLIRQPQLLAAMINAAFPSLLNPVHWLIRLLAFPVYLVAAFSIAISCMGTPTDQADPRRLSWHLQNNVKKTSLMCWLASQIWLRRLGKDYPNKMTDVAGIYYFPKGDNPYSRWWVT
jgi:hypothetical protein